MFPFKLSMMVGLMLVSNLALAESAPLPFPSPEGVRQHGGAMPPEPPRPMPMPDPMRDCGYGAQERGCNGDVKPPHRPPMPPGLDKRPMQKPGPGAGICEVGAGGPCNGEPVMRPKPPKLPPDIGKRPPPPDGKRPPIVCVKAPCKDLPPPHIGKRPPPPDIGKRPPIVCVKAPCKDLPPPHIGKRPPHPDGKAPPPRHPGRE